MERNERLRQAFNYLRGNGIVHTQVDVADKMHSNKSTISQALKGNPKFLTDNLLRRFNRAFDGIFRDEWLLNGEGDMLVPNNVFNQTINNEKNVISGTATNVGGTHIATSTNLEEVVKQQSEQIGKLIDDNAKRSEQIDKLINMLVEKL